MSARCGRQRGAQEASPRWVTWSIVTIESRPARGRHPYGTRIHTLLVTAYHCSILACCMASLPGAGKVAINVGTAA